MNLNLPNSTIVNTFLSDDEQDQATVRNLVEEFLSSSLGDKLSLPELSIYTFGDKYPDNYQRTRYFVLKLQEDLKVENLTLMSKDLAQISEGKGLTKISYQFTPKMLGLLLLAKNNQFREFVRKYNSSYVPYNLEKKKTNMRRYVVAYN